MTWMIVSIQSTIPDFLSAHYSMQGKKLRRTEKPISKLMGDLVHIWPSKSFSVQPISLHGSSYPQLHVLSHHKPPLLHTLSASNVFRLCICLFIGKIGLTKCVAPVRLLVYLRSNRTAGVIIRISPNIRASEPHLAVTTCNLIGLELLTLHTTESRLMRS
jgi:hypothetical protein